MAAGSTRIGRLGARGSWAALRRAALAAALIAAALAAGYLLWLRDSSLVAITEVTVTGADDRPELRRALEEVGLTMTTLNLDRNALEDAVGGDPAVRSISAETDFPRALAIAVELREPVGVLGRGRGRTAIAADGVVLNHRARDARGLPVITGVEPELDDGRIRGEGRIAARALGAAPGPLAELIEEARIDREWGLVIALAEGIEIRMGDAADVADKWAAAAAVLADRNLDSVAYVDVNVASRPVAGLGLGDPDGPPLDDPEEALPDGAEGAIP